MHNQMKHCFAFSLSYLEACSSCVLYILAVSSLNVLVIIKLKGILKKFEISSTFLCSLYVV